VAKTLIKISNNTVPFNLFHDMLAAHAVTKQRAEFSPKFLVMSSYLIGRQNISLMWPTSSTLIDLELKSAL